MSKVFDIPVVVFSMGERTEKVCIASFQKLGFKNIINLNQKIGFSDKLKIFFELYNSYESNLFIRTDADRICLPGIEVLCQKTIKDREENSQCYIIGEGLGYESFLENRRYRYATPHVYSREVMKYCLDNSKKLINNIQKPESFIGQYFKSNYKSLKNYEVLTNIHEFQQYPSKMYHAFLNRIARGHYSYYNLENIRKSHFYSYSMKKALKESEHLNKKNMNYFDNIIEDTKLIELDNELGPIKEEDIDKFLIDLFTKFQ
jgi:membrane-bound lytic murein transglycosylase